MAIRRHRARREVIRESVGHSAESELPITAGRATQTERSDRLFARAIKLLATRSRSEAEIRERLAANAEASAIDECIQRLKERGWIDDAKFASAYAYHRSGGKGIGRARIARELATRGVDRATIDKALRAVFQEVDEEALIDRAIEKRMRKVTTPLDPNAAKRLFDHLARLGFNRELIISRVRAFRAAKDD